jgi:hypothetical protein
MKATKQQLPSFPKWLRDWREFAIRVDGGSVHLKAMNPAAFQHELLKQPEAELLPDNLKNTYRLPKPPGTRMWTAAAAATMARLTHCLTQAYCAHP